MLNSLNLDHSFIEDCSDINGYNIRSYSRSVIKESADLNLHIIGGIQLQRFGLSECCAESLFRDINVADHFIDNNIAFLRVRDDDVLSFGWFGQSNWSRFVDGEDVKASTGFDINYVYIGNNATDLLRIDGSKIPGDVCVKINQVQEAYWIWVVSDNMDAINQLSILQEFT